MVNCAEGLFVKEEEN